MSAPAAGPGKHTAQVALSCGTAQQAEWVRRAIQAEVDEAPDGAACVLAVRGGELHAEMTASDLAGLRAALNTLVRLADAARGTVEAKGRA